MINKAAGYAVLELQSTGSSANTAIMKYALAILVSLASINVAAMHKCVDDDGDVSYQQHPCPPGISAEHVNGEIFSGAPEATMPARDPLEQLQIMRGMRQAEIEQRARISELAAQEQARQKDLDCKTITYKERKRLSSIEWQIKQASRKGQDSLVTSLERERAEIKCETYVPAPVTNTNVHIHW
jgi:hypothetical protein